jgi:preprotein translocase subunit SecA
MDPLTGENERALEMAGAALASGSPQQRAALPLSALPAGFERTGRNAPCPCGSGKKFKHCHGTLV